MSKKHYVVWKGKKTGVFDTWSTVQGLVAGMPDAQYMGFPSLEEATAAYKDTYTKALMKRSLAKGNASASNTSNSAPKKHAASTSVKADIQIYCDGACSPNPGKSGSGMAIYTKGSLSSLWYGLYKPNGTNNTAELNALLEAMKVAKKTIAQQQTTQILSDSKYSIDCITKWAKGWKTKGWKRGKGEEIKNLEIIQECFALYESIKSNIVITHVKGHANIEGNELSDRMAVFARTHKEVKFVEYKDSLNIPIILAMPSG